MIFLKPYFSHTIWGGRRLCEEFGYDEPGDDIGECWGISAHPSGESVVRDGEYSGMTLSQLWNEHRELFGGVEGDRFPLLVKLIDAREDLSIQVHPDDEYAYANENGSYGKKECWYVIDCPEGCELVVGHNARSREELCEMIDNGRWDELIRKLPVSVGDAIRIDPGTVHSITAGVCILETQQSSDITYRLYDYDRVRDGKKRPLQLERSKDVITVPDGDPEKKTVKAVSYPDNSVTKLAECDRYKVFMVKTGGSFSFESKAPFLNVSVISGSGWVFDKDVKKGDHLIITSEGASGVELSGDMEMIVSTL